MCLHNLHIGRYVVTVCSTYLLRRGISKVHIFNCKTWFDDILRDPRFPPNADLRAKWISAMGKPSIWEPTMEHRLCSEHFTSDNLKAGKLVPSAVPSIFRPVSIKQEPVVPIKKRGRGRPKGSLNKKPGTKLNGAVKNSELGRELCRSRIAVTHKATTFMYNTVDFSGRLQILRFTHPSTTGGEPLGGMCGCPLRQRRLLAWRTAAKARTTPVCPLRSEGSRRSSSPR